LQFSNVFFINLIAINIDISIYYTCPSKIGDIMGRLAKIPSEAKISGVCAGLSKYSGIDVTVIRVLFVLAVIFGVGFPILIYFILTLMMPDS